MAASCPSIAACTSPAGSTHVPVNRLVAPADFSRRHIATRALDGFIATGVMIAILIDLSRLPTYATGFRAAHQGLGGHGWALVAVGTLCAFAGAYLGVRYLNKATIGVIRWIVATIMLTVGASLLLGLLGS